MLNIPGSTIDLASLKREYPSDSIEERIINILSSSSNIYRYNSLDQLKFELNARFNIVKSSRELQKSRLRFRIFKKSICNTDYWERTEQGGFKLKAGVKPSEGIQDIYKHGTEYGTECSTAITIVYYKALLNIYPEELSNEVFANLHLANWVHMDEDLGVHTLKIEKDYLPGDCLYFKNPDFDPEKAEWRGENAIDMGNNTYYGHGIGIKNPADIIKALDKKRKPDAKESAYLTDYVTRPNFNYLANLYFNYLSKQQRSFQREFSKHH